MGLLRFESSGWQEIERIRSEMEPAARDRLDMTSALQKVIERGRVQVRGVRYTGQWGEIDSTGPSPIRRAVTKEHRLRPAGSSRSLSSGVVKALSEQNSCVGLSGRLA